MAVNAQVFSRTLRRAPAQISPDLRRHRRVQLTLAGRFMRADRHEYTCELRDISVGSASVKSDVPVELGERIVAYFDHLGGLEGKVVRVMDGGFSFVFSVTPHKREKLAAQIMWLINRDEFPDELGRQHERVGTSGRKTLLRLAEGVAIDVHLLDISASGASVATTARPAIGEEVVLGKIRSVVRRHHENGIGVQFLVVQDLNTLRASFS